MISELGTVHYNKGSAENFRKNIILTIHKPKLAKDATARLCQFKDFYALDM